MPIGEVLQVIQNIEQLRIDAMALAGAKVAQQMVDRGQTGSAIAAAIEIFHAQSLTRMGVHKLQASRLLYYRCAAG